MLTTPFSAEWGHTGGGVMILTSRGGTNNLHGYVYDYFRNRLLNARPVFGNASSLKYVQNNPGIAIGGPVVLPKIYDGRNRTFFFADFNVTLASNGNLYQQLVPTALQKAGDFSQTFASGSLVPIYDPAATAKLPNGSYSRPPFQDNRIPASRIDPIASRIAGFYPDPNGSFANGLNYSVAPPQLRQTWQSIVRVDQNIGDNDRMFVRFGRYNPNGDAQNRIPNKANNDTSGGFRDTQVAFSETHVFSARVVNDFRAGFVQEVNYTIPSGGPAPELGLAGVPLNEFPIIKVSQMIQLGSDPLSSDRNRSWVFSEALNVHLGRHTLKMGGDYRRQMYNFYEPGKLAGTYTFNPTFTSFPGKNGTGFGLADMLLGVPASTDFDGADYTYRMNINSAGMYLQDDFKIRSNLTLNLGLRWEYNGPYSEANGQFGSFLPNLVNRTTGNLGEVAFAGRDGQPSHFSPNIYRNFLPRIGFAWRALPKTVFRGGYGIYRLPSIGYGTTGPVSQYGVDQSFTSVDNNITPFYTFASGVPARSFNVDAEGRPNIPASLTRPTSNVTALETRDRTPYNQMWQFGIQRQVTDAWFIEVDYVGNKGTKLPVVLPWNQLRPDQFGSGSQQQGKRPYPQYLNVSALSNDGNSTYHSLQAKVEHLWRNGLQVQGSYTFSKLINDVDAPARQRRADSELLRFARRARRRRLRHPAAPGGELRLRSPLRAAWPLSPTHPRGQQHYRRLAGGGHRRIPDRTADADPPVKQHRRLHRGPAAEPDRLRRARPGRADTDQVFQHRRLHRRASIHARQRAAFSSPRPRHQQLGPLAHAQLQVPGALQPAIHRAALQRFQPPELQRSQHNDRESELRPHHRRPKLASRRVCPSLLLLAG